MTMDMEQYVFLFFKKLIEIAYLKRAAGVFMSVAAGNNSPSCSSVNEPPGIYGSVITVGATGYNTESIAPSL